MTYPGNPSLAPDVRQRILETWEHTRRVASEGKVEEARLGCDFILRLDPLFSPAQRLSDRLEGATGAVDVSGLTADADLPGDVDFPGEAEDDLGGLPELEEMPELPMEPSDEGAEEIGLGGEIQGEAAFASDLRAEMAELVATRDFPTLMTRAQEEQEAIAADPELQRLLAGAQEKMEAAPYVESFLEQAEVAYEQGNEEEARSALEKARSLDDDHPRVQALDAALGTVAVGEAEEVEALPELETTEDEAFPDAGLGDELAMEELPELPELDLGADAGEEWPGDTEPDAVGSFQEPVEEPLDEPFPSGGEELSLEGFGELPSLDDEVDLGSGAEESPAAAAAPSAPGGGPSDPDPRIAELLDEGQAAYERGEFQGAIDAWSRIFLIDIDHQEAARRIDLARDQKSEEERKVEEAFHEALTHAEAGEMDEAKVKLEEVLALAPNHVAAAQYLEKLEKGELTPEEVSASHAPAAEEELDLDEDLEAEPTTRSHPMAEVMVPPDPGTVKPRAAGEAVPEPQPAARPRKNVALVAAALVLVVLAVGGFLWYRSGTLFPNTESADQPLPVPVQETTPIQRATQLFDEGRAGVAIAQLKRIPPASPYYEEAQALLSQWEGSQPGEGPAPADSARRDALLVEANAAFQEGRHLEAIPLFEEAAAISALDPEANARLEQSRNAVRPLEPFLALVRAGEYDRAVRDLWLRREEDPNDRVVNRLLATSYYNLGIRSLQQGRPQDAIGHFEEVLNVTPDDEAASRLLDLARTYDDRSQDLLYRIYVKYLAPRTV